MTGGFVQVSYFFHSKAKRKEEKNQLKTSTIDLCWYGFYSNLKAKCKEEHLTCLKHSECKEIKCQYNSNDFANKQLSFSIDLKLEKEKWKKKKECSI